MQNATTTTLKLQVWLYKTNTKY